MKCPKCKGEGFIEYEAGLIQVECKECKGTGEIPDDNTGDSGIGRDTQNIGSDNPSKPKRTSKSKAKKKATKRAK